MAKYLHQSSESADELAGILSRLPEGHQVVAMYARGSVHWAWILIPDEPVKVTSPEKSVFQSTNSKKRKDK